MITMYQIDAFATELFKGNPAAVCPLQQWLPDRTMQQIAAENNLSETAFFVGSDGQYQLRWFTPFCEVDLCGHATLASAWVIYNRLTNKLDQITFDTRSGPLSVHRQGNQITLDLPSQPSAKMDDLPGLSEALGIRPQQIWMTDDVMAVFDSQAIVESIKPDFTRIKQLNARGVIVTAPGDDCDFVSRFFAPAVGVDEDPVTGSAHCKLTPYWSERLHKTALSAQQLSSRGGSILCKLNNDRVSLTGTAVEYMQGTLAINTKDLV